jgi:ADP-heptose:LPS heptosyltransferase
LLNWAGRTNLSQLTAVLAGAKLLLANETSATHLAAAAGVPAVCLLGGGHFGRFMPYEAEESDERPLPQAVIHRRDCFGCNWLCKYKVAEGEPVPCVEGITVADVWETIQGILQRRNG